MTIPTSSIEQVIPGQGSMAQPEAAKPGKAKRQRFRFVRNRKAAAGLIILSVYVLFAIIGPWVAPYDPSARSNDRLQRLARRSGNRESWIGRFRRFHRDADRRRRGTAHSRSVGLG